MKTQKLLNSNCKTNFGVKNTFLNKAKKALYVIDNDYWESLHYEAKARLNHKNFNAAYQELKQTKKTNVLSTLKLLSKILWKRLQSEIFVNASYYKFPDRYIKPDDVSSIKPRHYKIK